MPDARGIDVWMRWEFDKLNAGVVIHPKSLRSLLSRREELRSREGDVHDIDPAVLERFARACTPSEQERLRLPVTLHFSGDVTDSAYVVDELGAEVLHRLEGWGDAYRFREGRMWLPQSLAVDLMSRYSGALRG